MLALNASTANSSFYFNKMEAFLGKSGGGEVHRKKHIHKIHSLILQLKCVYLEEC